MRLKNLLPKFIHKAYMISQTYVYDCRKTLRYSFSYKNRNDNDKALLLMVIHTIEKGLTMPSARLNFGHERIREMIRLVRRIGKHCFETDYALETLSDYLYFHENRDVNVSPDINRLIMDLFNEFSFVRNPNQYNQYSFTSEEFFPLWGGVKEGFITFAKSRHTCRDYLSRPISDDVFVRVAAAASTSPTSCNRQTCKFYVIRDKKRMHDVLAIQGGNRGFGDGATAVLIVTSELTSYSDVQERNQPSINAGFYAMNILYALHAEKIGACVLNWSSTLKKEKALRTLVFEIDDKEQICLLISCGYPSENFFSARSKRRDLLENVVFTD